jgi:hypothetical protein
VTLAGSGTAGTTEIKFLAAEKVIIEGNDYTIENELIGDGSAGQTNVTGNVTVNGDNNLIQDLTIEGNYTDNGAGNQFVDSTQSIGGDAILNGQNGLLRNVVVSGTVEINGDGATVNNSEIGDVDGTESALTVTGDNALVSDTTIFANSNNPGVNVGTGASLTLSSNDFETNSSDTVYVTGDIDPNTVSNNNNFEPGERIEGGEIVVDPTDIEITSAQFDDGDSENDSVTILGSFLSTATEIIGNIAVGFGNIAGNIGLGNIGNIGNVAVEVGNQQFDVGNVGVGNNGDSLNISLDENIDLSEVDNDANINITIGDIDTTDADVSDGNVSVDLQDTDGNSVAQSKTDNRTSP